MVCTMPSGTKWWLFRHGILVSVLGVLLLILLFYLLLTIVFSVTLSIKIVLYSHSIVFSVILSIMIVFSGFAYSSLYAAIKELPQNWMAEDFDLVRCKVTLREGVKEYVVLYHGLLVPYTYWIYLKQGMWLDWQQAPGHYQIWTPYRGSTHTTGDRYNYLSHIRPSGAAGFFFPTLADSSQKETVFTEDLLRMVPHLHEKAKEISSLQFVGLARENIETIVVVFLTRKGEKQVYQALDLLKKIVQDAEGIPPSSEGWDE